MKQITVFVLAGNSQGEIEMLAYDLQVTQEQYDDGDHCQIAVEKAAADGYRVIGKFDSNEPAARQIMGKSLIYGDSVRYISEIGKSTNEGDVPAALSPGKDALIKIYGNDGSHPDYPRDNWAYEFENKDTKRGYWEWVDACLECDSNDPLEDDPLFDALFTDVIDGLLEYCPSLSDVALVAQVKADVRNEMVVTGDRQEDYVTMRNLVEQESQRAERTDQMHLYIPG